MSRKETTELGDDKRHGLGYVSRKLNGTPASGAAKAAVFAARANLGVNSDSEDGASEDGEG